MQIFTRISDCVGWWEKLSPLNPELKSLYISINGESIYHGQIAACAGRVGYAYMYVCRYVVLCVLCVLKGDMRRFLNKI